MKRILASFLLTVMVICTMGCGASAETAQALATESAVAQTVAVQQQEGEETEPDILQGSLFLKVSSITFSLVGETDDIYLGVIPRDLVTWESEDPSIVSVDNGVLTANGVGTTTIRASYFDRQVECTAGCLAETQEELLSLDKKILNAPTRILPEVNLEEECTYFDNAAMVGDSITYVMRQFEAKNNGLGNTVFLCRGGASVHGYLLGSVKLFYRGQEMRMEEAVAASEIDRIYILIGASDIVPEVEDAEFFEDWTELLSKMRNLNPDLEVIMLSITPASEHTVFYTKWNARVESVNEQLRRYAKDNGCGYLDLSYYVQDHSGFMPLQYSQDAHHFNEEGCMVWMQFLRYYAQFESVGGILS